MAEIYVLMGKSASGKDTVFHRLMRQKDFPWKKITMYTTRPMRAGEIDGREYFFTDEAQVTAFEQAGKMIELRAYQTVHGIWKYFTADDGQIKIDSDEVYLVIGTLDVFRNYVLYYGKEKVVPIYIETDEKTRFRRAVAREEEQKQPKYAELCRRFLADENDFSEENLKKFGIDAEHRFQNQDLDKCVSLIRAKIKGGR